MDNLSWQIGDVTITRIEEDVHTMNPQKRLSEASPAALERHMAWMQPHFVDEDGQLLMSIHALCMQVGDRRIVVDTCVGNDLEIPGFESLRFHTAFLESLAEIGFARDEVDTVICTHLHFDHVGWNTVLEDGDWVPTFPNARYVFCREEWEHWERVGPTGSDAQALERSLLPITKAGLADLLEPEAEVAPGITLRHTPGHTPGHVSVRIESRGERALITGDFAHHPVQLAEPSWSFARDTDPSQSEATRRRFLAETADTDVLVIGTHFAPPTAGYVVTDGDTWRLDPPVS